MISIKFPASFFWGMLAGIDSKADLVSIQAQVKPNISPTSVWAKKAWNSVGGRASVGFWWVRPINPATITIPRLSNPDTSTRMNDYAGKNAFVWRLLMWASVLLLFLSYSFCQKTVVASEASAKFLGVVYKSIVWGTEVSRWSSLSLESIISFNIPERRIASASRQRRVLPLFTV